MPQPPLGGGIKRWCCLKSVCLTSVCLSRTSGLSREQRDLGRLKLAQRYPFSRSKGQTSTSQGRGHIVAASRAACLLYSLHCYLLQLHCFCWFYANRATLQEVAPIEVRRDFLRFRWLSGSRCGQRNEFLKEFLPQQARANRENWQMFVVFECC